MKDRKIPPDTSIELAASPPDVGGHSSKTTIGWKSGTLGSACAAAAVLLLNLIIVIWEEHRHGFPGLGEGTGKRLLYSGDCTTTKTLNIVAHLLINIFSTILLGASNYCMQCLSAPTRAEVDRAHARSRWVDIGVSSIRNLRHIGLGRTAVWVLLALSSLPLHLVYNSTIFASIGARTYSVFTVNEAFAQNPTTDATFLPSKAFAADTGRQVLQAVGTDDMQRLELESCIRAYAQNYQTDHGLQFLVVSNTTGNFSRSDPVAEYEWREDPYLNQFDSCYNPYDWICREREDSYCSFYTDKSCELLLPSITSDVSNWKPFGKSVEYCLSRQVEQHCNLEYSIQLAVVVLVMGFFKVVLMLLVAFCFRMSPLITIGDGVASFLQRPDEATRHVSLLGKKEFRSGWHSDTQAPPYTAEPHWRIRAASKTRIGLFVAFFLVILGVTLFLLIQGIHESTDVGGAGTAVFRLPIGEVSSSTIINWGLPKSGTQGLIDNVIVANIPQIIFSLWYLAYNGLATTMSLASEWSQFAILRKGLRVSTNPKGEQRSTYFLQLPYRIGAPILVVSGILHWLISQSLFVVYLDMYTNEGAYAASAAPDRSYITCGYSPKATLVTIIIGVLSFVAIVVLGMKRLKSGMPVVGSCSAAIAANCHPGDETIRSDAAFEKVQWGVIGLNGNGGGHCGFSNEEVSVPIDGVHYQ